MKYTNEEAIEALVQRLASLTARVTRRSRASNKRLDWSAVV